MTTVTAKERLHTIRQLVTQSVVTQFRLTDPVLFGDVIDAYGNITHDNLPKMTTHLSGIFSPPSSVVDLPSRLNYVSKGLFHSAEVNKPPYEHGQHY